MNKELIYVIGQMATEKGIDKEILFEALESALLSASKKTMGVADNVRMELDRHTGALKVFARKSPPQLGRVSVRLALANALFLLERRIRDEQVSLSQTLPDRDVAVKGDGNRLEQVLVNLVVNALDAMPDDAIRLLQIVHSFAIVSFPVEVWLQIEPVNGGVARIDRLSEPLP
jgi:signal transduction histidine kinase